MTFCPAPLYAFHSFPLLPLTPVSGTGQALSLSKGHAEPVEPPAPPFAMGNSSSCSRSVPALVGKAGIKQWAWSIIVKNTRYAVCPPL